MTVGDLKKMLEKYPEEMEILNSRCSDYCIVDEDEWHVVEGVPIVGACWIMRSHPTMSDEQKKMAKKYLFLEGN